MKKFISILLIIAVCTGLSVSAKSDELLKNPGFEEGVIGWTQYAGKLKAETSSAYASDGNSGLKLYNRESKYATYAQELKDVLSKNGSGKYRASVKVRLADENQPAATGQLVINLLESGEHRYVTSDMKELTTKWQKFSFEKEIFLTPGRTLESALIYPQFFDKTTEIAPDICVDGFTLVKLSDSAGASIDPISVADQTRPEKTTVGAIRWDAWYGHDGSESSVVSQVEKSLSPAQFHFRAPFFASVTNDGRIEIPEYTQEIFDKEAEYAISAGLDYFAYVWYDSDMKKARQFHEQSKYANDIKMCCIMDGNAIGRDYAHKEMKELFTKDFYMKVLNDRPLMYYLASSGNLSVIAEDIKYYRNVCEKLGVNPPYAVIMSVSAGEAASISGDAVSRYATSASGGKPYAELRAEVENSWETWRKTGGQLVPSVTFGWDNTPRYYNPVSWTTAQKDGYAQYATDKELQIALENALDYLKKPEVKPFTVANTVIIYAWNEHDEGGWICPTIEVDENGNQIFDENGNAKINTGHLDAVKRAISGESDSAENESPSDTQATSSAQATASPDTAGSASNIKSNIWVYIGVGAAVIIVGAGAVIIIKKRQKK